MPDFLLLRSSNQTHVEGDKGERTDFGYAPVEKVLVNLPE